MPLTLEQRLRILDENLDHAIQADGECGNHHLANQRAEEWHKNNRELSKWLTEFKELIDDIK